MAYIVCPRCTYRRSAPDALVGKRISCPGCRNPIEVHAGDTPGEETQQPARTTSSGSASSAPATGGRSSTEQRARAASPGGRTFAAVAEPDSTAALLEEILAVRSLLLVLCSIVGLACAGLIGIGVTGILLLAGASKEESPQWEYTVTSPPDAVFTKELNDLGKQGWQLVFARRAIDSLTNEASYEVILQRRKRE